MSFIRPLCKNRKTEYLMSVHMLTVAHARTRRLWHDHPVRPDLFREHMAATAWGPITLSYSGIEQANEVPAAHAVTGLWKKPMPLASSFGS